MNVSFEDLANAGLPDEFPEPKRHWPRRLCLVGVVLFVAWAGMSLHFKQADAPRPLPESAKRLLVLEGDVPADGVLPHQIDDATEFEASFGNLKEGFEAPKFREAVLVGNGEEIATTSAAESVPDVVAPFRFRQGMIPAKGALDVYYVSPRDGVDSYILMVKQ